MPSLVSLWPVLRIDRYQLVQWWAVLSINARIIPATPVAARHYWGGPQETTGAGGRFVEVLIRKSKHSQSRKIRQGTNPQGHWLKSDWNISTERLQEKSGLLCHYWCCSMCNMYQSSRNHTNKLSTHISTKSSSIIFQCMIKRCQSVGNQFYNFWK